MGVAHPGQIKKVLMLGLGGGSISTYLGRFMPDVEIETVEIDPRVIETTKTYFGVRETPRVRYLASDGRVFLTRSKDLYDLILVDAYHGGFVPFHLLTREFYTLVKQHLTPEGAAAFNVHDGTKLYSSTVKTMADVFPALDIYSTWQGEAIIVVGAGPALSREQIVQRARELQSRYKFRFSLPDMIERRIDKPRALAEGGTLITDDFAPVNLYDTLGDERPKRK